MLFAFLPLVVLVVMVVLVVLVVLEVLEVVLEVLEPHLAEMQATVLRMLDCALMH